MKNFITRENIGERTKQLIIFIAHIVLLKWILYTLSESGILPLETVLLHFLGMSLYGAILIRTCAYIYKRQYLKELERDGKEPKLEK